MYCGFLKKKSQLIIVGYQRMYFFIVYGSVLAYLKEQNDQKPKF